jgi:hypothetical protein
LAKISKTWGYALQAPRRPPLKKQLEAFRSLDIDVEEFGPIWIDEVALGKRGRNAGPSQLKERNHLLDAIQPGDKVVVTDPYCLGVSRDDAAWFINALAKRGAVLIVSGHVYRINPGDDPEELITEVSKRQNAAHVAVHRAGGIGRKKPAPKRKKRLIKPKVETDDR